MGCEVLNVLSRIWLTSNISSYTVHCTESGVLDVVEPKQFQIPGAVLYIGQRVGSYIDWNLIYLINPGSTQQLRITETTNVICYSLPRISRNNFPVFKGSRDYDWFLSTIAICFLDLLRFLLEEFWISYQPKRYQNLHLLYRHCPLSLLPFHLRRPATYVQILSRGPPHLLDCAVGNCLQ